MNNKIYVTGFIGSDRLTEGEKIAKELDYELIELDKVIEENDGRSVMRIIMLMGEHEYRNKEYEALEMLAKEKDLVVVCGDGVLFDDMCAQIMKEGTIIVADYDKPCEELWEAAKDDSTIPYAFMQFSPEDEKRETFFKLYEQRRPIYKQYY